METVIWRKSSRSSNGGDTCVELAKLPKGLLGVRDSKNPDGGHLVLLRETAARLFADMRSGKLDL
jgi:hypothetical protein